ncbi:regulator of chromosome condensation 1/beta-lactamase-inhibitor protein II [Coemansia spiralis]|uniref:Alpha tubulin suppressor n=1 Tax=Coemansia umbellata TaxID=1424467 RepID=A0ABQ8PVY9_9FUNG|nr:regulator of chromosome condensation 1/beta-lactamase-inhibitor protein II [Coemansia spiralis]KAJ1996280.1 alpha tubulin suppressor [Coemansia umbellata]
MVRILALGSNSSGQLATGDMEDLHHLTICKFSDEAAVLCKYNNWWKVHGGGNHAFAWSADSNSLLGCGSNREGELALNSEIDNTLQLFCWTPIALPDNQHIKQIACGWNHTLLLTRSGQIYSCGSGAFGQLGTGIHTDNKQTGSRSWVRPVVLNAELNSELVFKAVACGLRHSLALTSDGQVYGWGANRKGQLGIAPSKQSPNVCSMTCVSQGLLPVAFVACGRAHSILVACDGRTVYVAGEDKHAQCGPSSSQVVAGTWRSFQLPRRALKLCSGWEFGAVLLEPSSSEPGGNSIAMWGRADHGQLSDGVMPKQTCTKDLVHVPVSDVVDFVCGSNHTVAVTSDGVVYMWGWNEHGNAGDPSLNNVFLARRIDTGGLTTRPDIGCGYGNSYLVFNDQR